MNGSWPLRLLRWTVTVASLVALIALSQVPWRADSNGDAVLRLSWRTGGQRVEECHAPTEEDLAGLPAHMRPPEVCERSIAPFDLALTIDGDTVVDDRIRPGGPHADRPIYVYREVRLPPGRHRVEIAFVPVLSPERSATEDTSEFRLDLDREIDLAAGDVALVTWSTGDSQLRVVTEAE